MPTETLYPDGIVTQTGLTGAVSTINGAEDGTWLVGDNSTNTSVLRVSFPTPTANPRTGAGLQTFRMYVRKTSSGGGDPSITSVQLRETGGGSALQTLTPSSSTITSTTGVAVTATWDATNLGTASGSAAELYVEIASGGGGPNERTLDFDSVSWTVDYVSPNVTVEANAGAATAAGYTPNVGTFDDTAPNLIPYSEDFAGQWTSVSTTETAGQDDPFGGTDASLVTANAYAAARMTRDVNESSLSEDFVFSIYTKNVDSPLLAIEIHDSGGSGEYSSARWSWSGGVPSLGSRSASGDFSVTGAIHDALDIGDGWYRVTYGFSVGATGYSGFTIRVYPALNDATSGVGSYFFGAQLERNTYPSTYKKTPSTDVSVTANTGTATVTGFSPTILTPITVTANVGTATATGFTPTVAVSDHQTVVANTGTATVAGFAPTVSVSDNQTVVANTGAATVAGFTPTIVTPVSVQANTGTATVAGFTPTVTASADQTVEANTGSATIAGFTPAVSVTANQVVEANTGTGTWAGFTPTISTSANVVVEANAGTATLAAFTPTVTATDHQVVEANLGTATLTGFTPTVDVTANQTVEAPVGAATAAGFTPTIDVTEHQVVEATAGAATLAGFTPVVTVGDAQAVQANTGAATLTGFTPSVTASDHQTVVANTGAATVAGFSPTISTPRVVVANVGTVTAAGFTPTVTVSSAQVVEANVGTASLTGFTPTVVAVAHYTVEANVGAVTVIGYRPAVRVAEASRYGRSVYMYAPGRVQLVSYPVAVVNLYAAPNAPLLARRRPTVMVSFGKESL